MKTTIVLAFLLALALPMSWVLTQAQEAQEEKQPEFKYVGVGLCARACHSSKRQGRQLPIWRESQHAKAYETLGTDKAKEFAKERGVTDPQKSGKCLRCHSTAYAFGETAVAPDLLEEGVGCELCHGPGSKYRKISIMRDKAKAMENGLLEANEATCKKCHNEDSPTWDESVPFDFKAMYDKIKHPKPE